jgi:D-alanyl-D-alanine carboxypeptidase/D-alanyl-D-alanine-endopeptidase (penicillin-binding protein 4)
MKIFGDSLPMIRYSVRGDTLFFTGTGNPANLHPHFRDSSMVEFLQTREHLVYVPGNFDEGRFGPGWAWEDFDGAFAPERSPLPLYGNVVTVHYGSGLNAVPTYFQDSIQLIKKEYRREEARNTFYLDPSRKDTVEIPFLTGTRRTLELLKAATGKEVGLTNELPPGERHLLMGSVSPDSLYKRMMRESDNFIAEQLGILASSVLADTLSAAMARDFVLDSYLGDMAHRPRWVDGSGLSRYNLFTPLSMVHVLEKLLSEYERERLFAIFPAGGKDGTLEDWYAGDPVPYVYAKSGTLGNTYCLSGYLVSGSGRLLIFSFMNNHFTRPTREVKAHIQSLLEAVRDAY